MIPFYHPFKIVTSQYRCCKCANEYCSSCKMWQISPVCKMSDNGRLTVVQKVKVVLFYSETKSVVATQRCFRAHFGIRWAPCNRQFTDFHQEQFSSLWVLTLYETPNAFFKINMCYVYNQKYAISCAILYIQLHQPVLGCADMSLARPERKKVSTTKHGFIQHTPQVAQYTS